jgi:anti-sigma factor RsiW
MQHVDEGLLHAYLDGELDVGSPADAEQVESHLAGCAVCRARLAEAQGLRARAHEILRVGTDAPRSAPHFDALLARAAVRPAGPRRTVDHRRTLHRQGVALGWAASLVIALFAGWFASEIRFRMAEPVAYGSREMQAVPAVAAPAANPERATPPAADAEVAAATTRETPVTPRLPGGRLTPAEFYALYEALPSRAHFERDADAAAETLRAWERMHPQLAQGYPAVHILRWFQSEAERAREEQNRRS